MRNAAQYSQEPEQVVEEQKTKKNTWGHMQAHKHMEKVRKKVWQIKQPHSQKKRQPKNEEAGEMCAYTGEMEALQEKKDRKKKRNMQLDHSVTHVKRKQNKNEMGTTKTASNAHNLEKAKQNT